MPYLAEFDRRAVVEELQEARVTFHRLLDGAAPAQLARPSAGTRWTNEQLLFHMLFGYLVVAVLLRMVVVFGRLPPVLSRGFATLLDSCVVPFHAVNYWGSCAGAKVFNRRRMGPKFDRVIASLQRRLLATSDTDLVRGMYYPTRWDPFFGEYMTLGQLYRYPTQHFDFHQRQLTLDAPRP
jgi:DinB superfamily